MKLTILIAFLFTASSASAVSYPPPTAPKLQDEAVIPVESIKLNEFIGASGSPAIPKTWKLMSVSNGEKPNSSNLWFQAEDGSIYLLQGVLSLNKFVLHEHAYKIPAKLSP